MNFDNSWTALLRPGEATEYFDINNPERVQLNISGYSRINAWWLAELSRLIYRQESDEIGSKAKPPTRNEVLERVNLRELKFFDKNGTQAAIIRSQDGPSDEFAVLVFRGTHELKDWLMNLSPRLVKWREGSLVHSGFKCAFDLVWKDVEEKLSSIHCPVFYTGHSLGAALATLAASRRKPHALYTFGSPRAGNAGFADTLKYTQVYRVVNNRDIVTTVPPPLGFHHVGELHHMVPDSWLLNKLRHDAGTADRSKRGDALSAMTNKRRGVTDPPEFLRDHSPINYVARLERQLLQTPKDS